MDGLGAVVACVAMLTGLGVPETPLRIFQIEKSVIEAHAGAAPSSGTIGALFWPYRRETGVPTIWLGPGATDVTLAHELTHWMQLKAGIAYWDHRLPHFVERAYATRCSDRVQEAMASVGRAHSDPNRIDR